jgi:ABC-2 type transport system ATP-binding protein
MLRFEGLGKSYGERTIFHQFRLSLGAGIYALQGANGIGKSTLLSILAGAQPADAGEVWIDGLSLTQSPLEARQRLSFVPDESPIYPFMTGCELLDFIAKAKKTVVGQDILLLLQSFGLDAYLHTRFAVMSLGTQKKFMLSAAWVADPAVLLLDEPSNGLDINARELLVKLFQSKSQRSTILFTTHDADFVAATGASVIRMD